MTILDRIERIAERIRTWIVSADMGFGHQRAAHGLFVKNRKLGVYKIEEVLATGAMDRETHPLRR